jgi:hypothetical protein
MRKFHAPVLVLAVAFAAASGAAFSQVCTTPLPTDVSIPSPGTSGRAEFLGVWGDGKWDGLLCHTLVIESLPTGDSAIAVYSHGAYSGWNIRAPGFYRVQGRFDGSTLHLDFPTIKARAEYRLNDGKLHGRYFSPQGTVSIILNRKP